MNFFYRSLPTAAILLLACSPLRLACLPVAAAEQIPGLPQQTLTLPIAGATPDGFTAEISAIEPGFGQLPVQVRIRPTSAAFSEDRRLTIRLLAAPSAANPPGSQTDFEFTVLLQRGQRQAEQLVFCPKWFLGEWFTAEIWEHGQRLAGYADQLPATSSGSLQNRLDSPTAALIESAIKRIGWIAAPGSPPLAAVQSADQIADLRALLLTTQPLEISRYNLSQPASLVTVLPLLQRDGRFHYSTVEQLPQHWLALDRCNVWVTQWATWQTVQREHPQAAAAMSQYLRCGGVLWLLDAPETEQVAAAFALRYPQRALKSAAALASGPAASTAAGDTSGVADTSGTSEAAGDDASDTAEQEAAEQGQPIRFAPPYFSQPLLMQLAGDRQRSISPPGNPLINLIPFPSNAAGSPNQPLLHQWDGHPVDSSEFETLSVGAGRIVCCTNSTPLPGSYHLWHQLELLSGPAIVPVINHRLDPVLGDWRFWTWAIPGVAQPPVYTFIGLLFVFVLLVGPLAYRLLNRYGRVYLMFLVAPLLALATTGILLAYGMLADGLATQGRIRQITWLCDSTGGAVRYWRSTYFAGRQTSAELRFPADARLEPYRIPASGSRLYAAAANSAGGKITIGDDATVLGNTFLPARQQVQFVAHRPLTLPDGLHWQPANGGQAAAIENRFDHPISEVIACDADGNHWFGGAIEPGQRIVLDLLDEGERRERLADLYLRHELVMPLGVVPPRHQGRTSNDWISHLINVVPFAQSASFAAPANEGVIDGWLAFHLDIHRMLPPGTYVAIAPITDDCIAIDGAKISNSIHYVIGELP